MSSYAHRSFSSGELTPAAFARTDLAKYASGARTIRNFICRKQGGVDSRPGTELVNTASGVTWLLPFVFNDAQSYVLAFSQNTLRIVRAGADLGVAVTTPYAAADLSTLQLSQSADVVTIVHPNYAVMELKRITQTNWTLTAAAFGPSIAAPAGLALTPSTGAGQFRTWLVTALAANGEESYGSNQMGIASIALPTQRTLSWTPVAGAVGYNVYTASYSQAAGGVGSFGFIGTTTVPGFYDPGITPDFANQPPVARTLFAAVGDYPAAIGSYQQRRVYGGSTNEPETVRTSQSANTRSFLVSFPTQDDDAITFTLVGSKVNQVRHVVDADGLILFTSGGSLRVTGDQAGVLRPTDVNVTSLSDFGAATLPPIKIDQRRVLFVESRQTVVRALAKDYYAGTLDSDQTILSSHLFEGYTLVSWAYQKTPHSIIWCVRSDGVLLGLTDVKDQEVLAWHRHDTLGTVESVCVVPEGREDRVYLVVNRNGVRMIERMASRFFTDINDAITTDATLSYDGRNTSTITMTVSGGTTWTAGELLTLTASASYFGPTAVVGDAIVISGSDGLDVRFTIQTISSPTIATGYTQRTVPGGNQGSATAGWSRAVPKVGGLSHLEGQRVSVMADGFVVANPNNPTISTVVTVVGGVATLDQPYTRIHVGLPYVCDLETLDLDTPQGASLRDKKLLINKVTLEVVASRGIWAGTSAPASDSVTDPLYECKARDTENYSQPIKLLTGVARVNVQATWNQDTNGRVFIRQVDPVPLTILAVIPTGFIPPASN